VLSGRKSGGPGEDLKRVMNYLPTNDLLTSHVTEEDSNPLITGKSAKRFNRDPIKRPHT